MSDAVPNIGGALCVFEPLDYWLKEGDKKAKKRGEGDDASSADGIGEFVAGTGFQVWLCERFCVDSALILRAGDPLAGGHGWYLISLPDYVCMTAPSPPPVIA